MSGPCAREIGRVEDMDGRLIVVSADHDRVVLGGPGASLVLTCAVAEEFAALFVAACWEAARNSAARSARQVPNPERNGTR
jgi:hypothetical protein